MKLLAIIVLYVCPTSYVFIATWNQLHRPSTHTDSATSCGAQSNGHVHADVVGAQLLQSLVELIVVEKTMIP